MRPRLTSLNSQIYRGLQACIYEQLNARFTNYRQRDFGVARQNKVQIFVGEQTTHKKSNG